MTTQRHDSYGADGADGADGAEEDRAGKTAVVRAPSPEQVVAWRTLLIAHAQITRRLEAELVAEHELPLASYDVLLQLAEAQDRSLRMIELADRVLLSRSGLSRLVDRLVREGLVERAPCPEDARGTLAVLTPGGLERLREASVTHLRGVHDHVTSRLEDAELAELARLLTKLTPPARTWPGPGPDVPGPART